MNGLLSFTRDHAPQSRRSWLVAALLLTCLAGMLGCTGPLATIAYLAGLNETPPEFAGLKGKKVAVIVRPTRQLEYSSKRPASELAVAVGKLLKQNVSGIKLISQQKIREWADEHEWEDFTEVGKAVGAEMIVAIDLETFSLYQGQTIFQGRAEYSMQVISMLEEGKTVFEKPSPPVVFPPRAGIPTQERTEPLFREQFIRVVATTIAQSFYRHDHRQNYAIDSTALGD